MDRHPSQAKTLPIATITWAALLTLFALLAVPIAAAQVSSTTQFTIVVLPDTQNYSDFYPDEFTQMTQWIVANQATWNIQAVIGEGDITNYGSDTRQWNNAKAAINLLDGKVPYFLAIGNHDYDYAAPNQRSVTTYTSSFASRYTSGCCSWITTHWPNNTYRNFSGSFTVPLASGNRTFLVIAAEFYPTPDSLAGVQSVLEANKTSSAEVILTTHSFVLPDDARRQTYCDGDPGSYGLPATDSAGENMWNSLLKNYNNLVLVVNGHFFDGTAQYASHRSDLGLSGNLVNQMVADYQGFPLGGDGYMRLLTFDTQADTIRVQTYSPVLGQFLTDARSAFSVPWHGSAASNAGTATIAGHVYRKANCSTVAGATITATAAGVPPVTTTADSSGNFSLTVNTTASPTNLYTVTAAAAAIATTAITVNATHAWPAYIKFEASDPQPANITGSVTTATGTPVAKASIKITGPMVVKTTTDSTGKYTSGALQPGTYTVTASKGGYMNGSVSGVTVVQGQSTTAPTIILQSRK